MNGETGKKPAGEGGAEQNEKKGHISKTLFILTRLQSGPQGDSGYEVKSYKSGHCQKAFPHSAL